MVAVSQRRTLAPLALLTLPVGAYLLVLIGAVPMIRETDVLLTGIAGVAALGAALLRATLPALCAATATLGFGLGVIASGFVVTVAAVLAIIGGLGFLLTTIHLVGSRAYNAMPA